MKNLLFVVALTLMVSALAFAQTGVSSPNTASFEVGAVLEVTPEPGEFGPLVQGTDYTITADGSIVPMNADGDNEVTPILWQIEGNAGANVIITFALPPYFENVDGTGFRIPYTVTSTSAGWASEDFGPAEPYNPIDPRVSNTINLVEGVAAVQLGGRISVPVGAPEGEYVGQFVLTAQYTGFGS